MKANRAFALALLVAGGAASSNALADGDARSRQSQPSGARDNDTTRVFKRLGKNAIWRQLSVVPMRFPTFHTQGLVKIGDRFYVSAVELLEKRVSNGAGPDRAASGGRRAARRAALRSARARAAGGTAGPRSIPFIWRWYARRSSRDIVGKSSRGGPPCASAAAGFPTVPSRRMRRGSRP